MENENKKINTIGLERTTWGIVRMAAPTVLAAFLQSLLQNLDDGLFLSRYAGIDALAAFNLCFPMFMLLDSVNMILCSISVYCSTTLGEGRHKEANRAFSTICLVAAGFGAVIMLLLFLFLEPILKAFGLTENLMPYAVQLMSISRWYMPLTALSVLFNRFYIPAGKPRLASLSMMLITFCNFFFDWLFIVKMDMGIRGSAFANLIATSSSVLLGLLFYSSSKAEIRFTKPSPEVGRLVGNCIRLGFADATTSLALSLNSYISNMVVLGMGGETLVSAYSVVGNITFSLAHGVFGLMGATSPLVSYAYGERNQKKMVKLFRQILVITTGLTVIVMLILYFARDLFISLYVRGDIVSEFRTLLNEGLAIAPLGYMPMFFNVYTQSMFLSVNNPKVSTILSLFENVLMSNLTVLVLPRLFGATGLWYTLTVTELFADVLSIIYIYRYRDEYGYGRSRRARVFEEMEEAPGPAES